MSQTRAYACPDERLVELAHGALDEAEADELEEHAASCAVCGQELRWLSAESAMFAARADQAPRLPADTFDKIAAQIAVQASAATQARRRRTRTRMAYGGAGLFAAAAAAAVVMLATQGRAPTDVVSTPSRDAGVVATAAVDAGSPAPAPGPTAHDSTRAVLALDSADHELDLAIAQLQQDYQRRRARLPQARARRYDREFGAALTAVENAREQAGADVSARHQVMRARARYLRSMQTVVLREGRSSR